MRRAAIPWPPAQTGSLKLHSLFLCFRPSHAGRSLVSDDAQRLCELCSIGKNISPLCLACGPFVLLAAGGAHRSPQPSLHPSMLAGPNSLANARAPAIPPHLTSPHTALPPLLSSSSHHLGVPLSYRCQMTTNTKRQSRHQRCVSASIPTNFARFTAVGLC